MRPRRRAVFGVLWRCAQTARGRGRCTSTCAVHARNTKHHMLITRGKGGRENHRASPTQLRHCRHPSDTIEARNQAGRQCGRARWRESSRATARHPRMPLRCSTTLISCSIVFSMFLLDLLLLLPPPPNCVSRPSPAHLLCRATTVSPSSSPLESSQTVHLHLAISLGPSHHPALSPLPLPPPCAY